jgi:hypothetical protein
MTILVTTTRTHPAKHAYTVPVVRELPAPRPQLSGAAGAW